MGEMVSIPVEEYRMLQAAAEDLADLRAFDHTMAQLAADKEELLPGEMVKRLIGGESPLRIWREYRGYTQTALAELSGVNRVQIADIEAGRKHGSIETVKKLADALHVSLEDLV